MQPIPKHPLYRNIFVFAALLAFFTWWGLGHLDPDFGWHLRAGRDILAHGIPKTDLYTYTAPQFAWIDHEWLSDILLAVLYGVGGWALVNLVYATVWSLALWIASKRKDVFVLGLAALAISTYAGTRQLVWTALFFVLALRIMEGSRRRNWLILPLIVLWANLHGGFILGLAVLGLHFLRHRTKKAALLTAVGSLLTLINPYGWRIYIEIFRTLFDSSLHRYITEWQTLNWSFTTWGFIALSLGVFLATEPKKITKLVGWRGLSLAAAISSTRNVTVFILVWISDLETRLAGVYPKIKTADRNRQIVFGMTLIPLALLIVLSSYAVIRPGLDPERHLPYRAVAYLREHPCEGRLFNDYGYGGYLIWKLPGVPVYIDGRMPSWETEDSTFVARYFRVQTDESYREQEFERFNIRCVLISKQRFSQDTIKWLTDRNWRNVVDTPDSVLLIKQD